MLPDLTDLAKQGPAWVLLVFAIGVIAYLYKQLAAERKQCMDDFKTVVVGNTTQLKEQQIGFDARTRVLEAQVIILEKVVKAIDQNTTELTQFGQLAREAMNSHQKMREALSRRGLDL